MTLQHTVIQQMTGASVGKCGTFKLYCVHFMDKAGETQHSRGRDIKGAASIGVGGKTFASYLLANLKAVNGENERMSNINTWMNK